MRKIFIVSLICLISLALNAQNIPKPMDPPRLVNDFAGILTGDDAKALEDSLDLFSKTTSIQIAIVTVNDLGGYAPSDYALAILRGWGVGIKEKNNGIVLLLKPRNEYGRGEVYISVGGGLEGVLNDAKAGRVIDNFMIEDLSSGDYLQAVIKGSYALRCIVRGEFTADEIETGDDDTSVLITLLVVVFVTILVIYSSKKRKGGNFSNGSGNRTSIPPFFMGGFGGSSKSGSFRGLGGFGGFGGGSGFGGGAGRSF